MRIKHISFYHQQVGFTVIELMISLALLLIMIALGYLFFFFGLRTYDTGEQKAIAQQAARITSDFITTELRFAELVEINPSTSFEAEYQYIYLSNDSIYHRDQNGNTRALADSSNDGMPYYIEFSSSVPYDVIIFFIEADDDLYRLDSRVQALNLDLLRTYDPESGDALIKRNEGDNTSIKYKKPD